MTTYPHQKTRDFDDPEVTAALIDQCMPFDDPSMLDASVVDDSPKTLDFPATQTAIAKHCGLSNGTIHAKFTALCELHGKSLIFVERYGEKLVTEIGFGFLQDLIAAGNIKNYRRLLDERAAAEEAAAQVAAVPAPQFTHPTTPIAHPGTPAQPHAIPHLSLVPSPGTLPTYAPQTGLPIAHAGNLAYYQPTPLAHQGAGAVDLASQLIAAITTSFESTHAQTAEELQAVRSQRAALQARIPEIQARIAVLQATNTQAAVALDHEKKLLAQEAAQLQALAAQAGYSVEGLSGLFQS